MAEENLAGVLKMEDLRPGSLEAVNQGELANLGLVENGR